MGVKNGSERRTTKDSEIKMHARVRKAALNAKDGGKMLMVVDVDMRAPNIELRMNNGSERQSANVALNAKCEMNDGSERQTKQWL